MKLHENTKLKMNADGKIAQITRFCIEFIQRKLYLCRSIKINRNIYMDCYKLFVSRLSEQKYDVQTHLINKFYFV